MSIRTQYHNDKVLRGLTRALRTLVQRRLPLLGYLVLALGIGGAVEQNRVSSRHATQQIVQSTKAVLYENCQRGNRLRVVLKGLVLQELPAVDREVSLGRLTAKEAAKAKRQIHRDADKVGPVVCAVTQKIK